jgi:hypothetical protein
VSETEANNLGVQEDDEMKTTGFAGGERRDCKENGQLGKEWLPMQKRSTNGEVRTAPGSGRRGHAIRHLVDAWNGEFHVEFSRCIHCIWFNNQSKCIE